ncbi:hypothetical protein RQP53_08610 [Paucibacter sp. APW11]|uniref:Lipoprotein n=1 Tax=Roseateles aquae TaxID=3077235 RepID=A0ABU3P9Q7_9BURK|nr:hypothetical protein [Paucibacter sp. APW11]MDT8999324.1 hypothetical protein [Paucibacter sp. APW11]
MNRITALLAPLTLCLLTACGGGGSGDSVTPPPPTAVNPEGLWQGTAASGLDSLKTTLLADADGYAYAVLNNGNGAAIEALFMSNLNSDALKPGNASSTGMGYYRHVAGGFYQSVAMATVSQGQGSSQQSLQFQVGKGLDSSEPRKLTLSYDKGYEQAPTLESVYGRYVSKQSGHAMAVLSLSGANRDRALLSDSSACGFSNSRISASSTGKNLFSVVGILSGPACGFQGAASGVGYATLDSQGKPIGFTLALRESSGKAFFVFQGDRS